MKYPRALSAADVAKLEFEFISVELRNHLTRLVRSKINEQAWEASNSMAPVIATALRNQVLSIVSSVTGCQGYNLIGDDDGEFSNAEFIYHESKLTQLLRSPSTAELVEILCDLQEANLIEADLSALFRQDGSTVSFEQTATAQWIATVAPIQQWSALANEGSPNLRLLVDRLDRSIADEDPSLALLTCSQMFETIAKHIVVAKGIRVAGKPLGRFEREYRACSRLETDDLDFIFNTYVERNSKPLAAHGSLDASEISLDEAKDLAMETKRIVKLEYSLYLEAAAAQVEIPVLQ